MSGEHKAVRAAGRDWALLTAWLASLALIRSGSLDERDPYWQIRAGLENLAGAPLARPDTWSWAPIDNLFYPNSPGWNLLLAGAYKAGGFWGLFALSVVAMGGYLALTVLVARALGARPLPGLVALVPLLLLALPWFSPRATIIVQASLMLSVHLCLVWRPLARGHGPLVNALVVGVAGFTLSAAGNWIHLSWIPLSLLVAAAWAVFWLLDDGLDRHRRWALISAGAIGLVLGTLTTPYGVAVGLERAAAAERACAGLIVEWLPLMTPGLPAQWLVTGIVGAAATLACVVWVATSLRRGRPHAPTLPGLAALTVIAAPATIAGFVAVRFQGVALLTLAPIAAVAGTIIADRAKASAAARPIQGAWRTKRLREWATGHPWRVILTSVIVVLSPGTALLALLHAQPPEHEIAARIPQGCHLFSDDGTSGAIVLLRPDVKVWIDGRADYYGRERLTATREYLRATSTQVVPAGTTCVVLPAAAPESALLAARLARDPAWIEADREKGFTLWLPSA